MSIQCPTFTRVLRLRLKDKHARTLREHAYWVNQVWNYCNELSFKVLQRERRFLSGFDLQKYTAGATCCGAVHDRDVNAAKNIAAWGLLGVEARVSAARLERDAEQAKARERKTKLAVNKAAKAAAAGHGRPAEGIPVLSRVSGQPLG